MATLRSIAKIAMASDQRMGVRVGSEYWSGRGVPWEFDPGPPRNRSWGRLFAETPNYRGLGLAVTGREAFRWHFGPMFYRGRLWDDSVKVLIIGQEGAQDESLAGRSFVGGTGARMQHFLRHLGISRSYLFLNTFVYPIFGQYTSSLRGLAQDPRSPIARHRNEIFDYALARNDIQLVVAVGNAAKESVVSWVKSRGGTTGAPNDVSHADPSVLGPRVRLIGVVHPGSATGGNGTSGVKADFIRAVEQIEEWADDDPTWLQPDPGETRGRAEDYEYLSAPIPFHDLPFGVCWRLGRGGTSSNRSPDQRAIQLFGAGGHYNGRGDVLVYSSAATGSEDGYAAEDGDLPYEPPRRSWREFDSGPPSSLARLLNGGVSGLEWPDFAALGLPGDGSLGSGPVYRGRWANVKAFVLADQQSHDDVFSGRALCGEAGQRLQGFLEAMGVARDYLILRVLPVDTSSVSISAVNAAVDHPQTRAIHADVLRRVRAFNKQLGVMLAIGPQARRLLPHLPTGSLPVVEMKSWRQSGSSADWEAALSRLEDLSYATDTAPTFEWDGLRRQIPSADLPYGLVKWRASSGDRAVRPSQNGSASPHYLKLFMPSWAFRLPPNGLSASEQAAVDLIG